MLFLNGFLGTSITTHVPLILLSPPFTNSWISRQNFDKYIIHLIQSIDKFTLIIFRSFAKVSEIAADSALIWLTAALNMG
jgi:hypothetical protein